MTLIPAVRAVTASQDSSAVPIPRRRCDGLTASRNSCASSSPYFMIAKPAITPRSRITGTLVSRASMQRRTRCVVQDHCRPCSTQSRDSTAIASASGLTASEISHGASITGGGESRGVKATHAADYRSIRRLRPGGDPGKVGARYLLRVEAFRCRRHPGKRLRHGHRRGRVALLCLVEAHRVDARNDVIPQVGRSQPLRLKFRDDALDLRVDFTQPRSPGIAIAQRRRERTVAKPIDLLEKRAVRTAAEARIALVDDPERE